MAFACAILLTTGLLMLPAAAESHTATAFKDALFTATSAICVTGLTVVDTAGHWSTFGELVVLGASQIGGLGIVSTTSLLALTVTRRLGLSTRLLAQAETKALDLGDVRRVLFTVVWVNVLVEGLLAVVLWLRLWLTYGESAGRAAYHGVFHSISAFNNAGFTLWPGSLERFATDGVICVSIAIGILLGGIGIPVIREVTRELRHPSWWSMHTRLTLGTTALLLVIGFVVITALEWSNPQTLGPLGVPGKLLTGFFQAVTPRSAGLSTIDYSSVHETTLLVTDVLMFIGGGSLSVAGGIKVTTFIVLFFAIVAEVRGERDINIASRRVPQTALRQALSIALLGVAAVVIGTMLMVGITGQSLDKALFEVTSAFATVGASTGITSALPPAGQYLLVALMFTGRLGTVALASTLALRERPRLYRQPEERPIIG